MSKCTLRLEFDRPDRRYQGGDVVRGTASVVVQQDFACKEVRIEYYWRTHGRGNIDRGAVGSQQLLAGRPLLSGERLTLPFDFLAPTEPLTYRGHYLNVDHYVKLVVDVAWSTNPTLEEEYLLDAGRTPEYFSGKRDVPTLTRPSDTVQPGIVWKMLAPILLVMLLAALAVFSLLLLPLVTIGVVIYLVRRSMLKSRLGDVDLKTPHLVVSPAEPWPFELSFTPRRDLSVNGISIQILSEESCTSGTGTDRKTYRHEVHKEQFEVLKAQPLLAGKPFRIQSTVLLPATKAYSFKDSSNELRWTAEVRIDIPRAPDWKKVEPLQMVPPEFIGMITPPASPPIVAQAAPPIVTAGTPSEQRYSEPTVELGAAEYQDAFDDVEEMISASDEVLEVETTGAAETLEELFAEIAETERLTSARQQVVEQYFNRVFSCVIMVERVTSTYGQDDDRYNDGRTIVGRLKGTDHAVRLFLLQTRSAAATSLTDGSLWEGRVELGKWDGLYNRLDLYESD